MLASLPPEQQLIVECVRRALGLDSFAPPDRPASWEIALPQALEQGLAPVVHSGMSASPAPVPAPIKTALRAQYLAATIRVQSSLEPVLRRALNTLKDQRLEPIVLKGAALAYLVYPELVHRSMGDVDLLLPRDQVEHAREALIRHGFWTDESDLEPTHHLRPFHVDNSPVTVDLHHAPLIEPHPFRLDLNGLWARSQTGVLAGVEARVLSASDALHLTCLHLAYSHRYRFFQLRHLVDILAITARGGSDLSWSLFLDTVRCSRTTGAVYWPLRLSHEWLGAPIPADLLSELAPPAAIRRLVEVSAEPRFILESRSPTGRGSSVLYNLILNFSLYSGCPPGTQAAAVLEGFFPPPELVGHLPPDFSRSKLRYAAYLLRPARIARGVAAARRVLLRSAGE